MQLHIADTNTCSHQVRDNASAARHRAAPGDPAKDRYGYERRGCFARAALRFARAALRSCCGRDWLRRAGRTSRRPWTDVAEDDDVAAVLEHQLEVAAAQRPAGPPAVLDDPVLAHGLYAAGRRRRSGGRRGRPRRAPAAASQAAVPRTREASRAPDRRRPRPPGPGSSVVRGPPASRVRSLERREHGPPLGDARARRRRRARAARPPPPPPGEPGGPPRPGGRAARGRRRRASASARGPAARTPRPRARATRLARAARRVAASARAPAAPAPRWRGAG